MSITSSLLRLIGHEKNEPRNTLKENLKWSKKIDDYVKNVILFSSNSYENCRYKKNTLFSHLENHPSISIGLFLTSARENMDSSEGFEWIKETAAYAKKYNVGNCAEMAAVGYEYSAANRSSLSVEVFHIVKGDHVFLVLGREPNSDPNDYTTWGPDAVVCDPWSHETYPAKDLLKKLKDYKRVDEHADGSWKAITAPFDPKTQSLSLMVTSPSLLQEVDEDMDSNDEALSFAADYLQSKMKSSYGTPISSSLGSTVESDDNTSSSVDDDLYSIMESNNKKLSFAVDYLQSMKSS